MKELRILLVVHAVVTFAAAVVLIVSPTFIPAKVDIRIYPEQYLLSYILGAAELGIAYLSFQSRKIIDTQALRIIVMSFIVFHLATALLELYELSQGLSPNIIGNVVLRFAISILFYFYGIQKLKMDNT